MYIRRADIERVTQPVRIRTAPRLTLALLACLSTVACTASTSAEWNSATALPDKKVSAPGYEAVAALPDLTAKNVAKAAGLDKPVTVTDEEAVGEGWRTSVEQSPFVTRVQMARECTPTDAPVTDTAVRAVETAKAVFADLGMDPDSQAWFTIAGADGDVRVYAEPILDGTQTWSTGIYVARADEAGVCALSASLMGFEPTGKSTTLVSARDAFNVAEEGTYDTAERTYTLGSGGRLTPLWRFTGDDAAAVVVDLGDGLESAPDTETFLRAAATTAPD